MKNSQSAIAMLIAASATLAACQANGNRPPTSTVLEVGAGSIGSSSSANSHDRTIEELVDPTAPSISRKGPALQVTAKGLAYAIDLQSLLDVDHGFQPVGRNPDLDHDASVLETTVSGLFSMGYFDQMGTLSQTQVDEGLNGVRLTKPIRIDYLDDPNNWQELVVALRGDKLLMAAVLAGSTSGKLELASVLHPGDSRLASFTATLPAFSRQSGYRAASLYFPRTSQSAGKLRRVKSPTTLTGTGPLSFCWVDANSPGSTLITSSGNVFESSTGFSVQAVQQGIQLQKVGKVEPDPDERSLLENQE